METEKLSTDDNGSNLADRNASPDDLFFNLRVEKLRTNKLQKVTTIFQNKIKNIWNRRADITNTAESES